MEIIALRVKSLNCPIWSSILPSSNPDIFSVRFGRAMFHLHPLMMRTNNEQISVAVKIDSGQSPDMCGRYTRYLTWGEIHALYRLTAPAEGPGRNTEARYNIAPTQTVDFITWGNDGNHKLREGRWWLVPWWAKEMPKAAMFNARIETVATSGAFKDAFKSKRCLIPADGFYEWTVSAEDKGRDPWHIFQPGHAPFSFAGLWAHNEKLDVTSCTIITAPAGSAMKQLHDRQPVILDPAYYDAWLHPETGIDALPGLLSHDIDDQLQFHRVCRDVNATVVNKQRNDMPHFIEPFPNPL